MSKFKTRLLLLLTFPFTLLSGCSDDSSSPKEAVCLPVSAIVETTTTSTRTTNLTATYDGDKVVSFFNDVTLYEVKYAGDSMFVEFDRTINTVSNKIREVFVIKDDRVISHTKVTTPYTAGQVTQNKLVGTFTYDSKNLVTKVAYKNFANTLDRNRKQTATSNNFNLDFNFTYDANNNLVKFAKVRSSQGGTSSSEVFTANIKVGNDKNPRSSSMAFRRLYLDLFDSEAFRLYTKHNFFTTLPTEVDIVNRQVTPSVTTKELYTFTLDPSGNISTCGVSSRENGVNSNIDYIFTYKCQ